MKQTYNPLRRLHFYAAFFITPLLLTLSLTGIGYLFYTNVENNIYHDQFFSESQTKEHQSLDDAIKEIENVYKGYHIQKISIMDEPYNNRVTIGNDDGESRYIFLDKHNQRVANQNALYTYSNVMRSTHSSLMVGGTFVNYLVELAACWTIFMIGSGIYLTFKSNALKKSNHKTSFIKNRRLHAILGLIIAIPIFIIVLTGIPWSAFMGKQINQFADEHPKFGYTALMASPPQSEDNELPWATRNKEKPESKKDPHKNHHGGSSNVIGAEGQQSLESIISISEKEGISKPFSIVYPEDEKGVFTVSKGSNTGVTGLDVAPKEETTAYFDQYSGKNLGKVNYEDYGIIGKWFSYGIPLHEGHLFGTPNKIINLFVCLAFIGGIIYGFMSWMKRRKEGTFSAPKRINGHLSMSLLICLIVLGVLMPLFGASLIIVAIIEAILYRKNKKLSTK
ncbi:PepSY-associated TM helix domain-containing protein [Mammaliicoccus stepanovicii]|uniref:PepSY-associated TM helix family protein n=1 Tax=Mammaliicoccus stepanovicii TaxID=643214 RepID=A0A239YXM8_9STAP|nr:PepSY domain-containing protein [Mammaliicoccus stepanovicii]PNZ74404.1 PepSY domain-containing protein [Mammaliicoccus stepanovicii]GGI40535.1 sulfite reductase subunit alpha [Mammaliicoccus stepanovicii]SNV63507.1 pepSY-associated TM helix family protein [Mammaliicoccus stepanovicii]